MFFWVFIMCYFVVMKLPSYISKNFIPKYLRILKYFCVFISRCDKKNYCLQDFYDINSKDIS